MEFLKNIFRLFWRIWFYVCVFLSVLILLPVLIFVIYDDKRYHWFFKIARGWGKFIVFAMGFTPKVTIEQKTELNKNYMFIANHASLVDVMLMLSVIENPAVFVGKKELTKLPVFGYVFKKTSILVDRKDPDSRKKVYESSQDKLNKGLSVIIFPEGLVPEESVTLAPFKNGAFSMAIEHQIPIVPMTFYNVKERFSWTFFSGWPGNLYVKVHPFIETKGKSIDDMETIKQQAFDLIHGELVAYEEEK